MGYQTDVEARGTGQGQSWLAAALDRYFRISHFGSTVRTEILAGLTTFLAASYVIVVNPAILLPAGGGESVRLGQPGLLIGVDVDATYEVCTHAVPPGSRLYLYSDGVTEATRTSGELVGIEGLESMLRILGDSRGRAEHIYRQIIEQAGSPSLDDDFSLVELTFG